DPLRPFVALRRPRRARTAADADRLLAEELRCRPAVAAGDRRSPPPDAGFAGGAAPARQPGSAAGQSGTGPPRRPAGAGEDAEPARAGRPPPAARRADSVGTARRPRGGRLPLPPAAAGRRPAGPGPCRRGGRSLGAGHT